ncbi:DUF4381 domain-containing protein [Rehaibacterium terrae]|uniref:DUF4381 domain-containing protein n=1 Tax=Rehaibacterium terrae TaxID=1341696 RepID=A0A7W7Y0Y0_9GAMM|nr:DUF4381 domain-containing protein [Rehaibacterium terrae]MBB5016089.1 hypothetical protein [Rehaibacterium terrae]
MNLPPLRDIHLPPEPGLWPPAPGWWVLIALALIVIVALARRALRAWRRRRRRRALLAEFDTALATARDAAEEAAALSSLLRRAARLRDPAAAALAGEAWLRFLDGDDPRRAFSQGVGRALLEAPFRPSAGDWPREALRALVRDRLLTLAEPGDA